MFEEKRIELSKKGIRCSNPNCKSFNSSYCARGLCCICYNGWLRHNSEKYRNTQRELLYKWRKKNKSKLSAYGNLYVRTLKGKFLSYKDSAKRSNLFFNLSLEEFSQFWQKPCYYCGSRIETIGLDRVNNNKGYELNNIVSCCKVCNRAKNNFSPFQFLFWINNLIQFQLMKNKDN